MRVTVEVLGSSELFFPLGEKEVVLELPATGTVQDAIQALGASDDAPWNASIDGQLVYADTPLDDGARILVFAPIQGGGGTQHSEGETKWCRA